MSNQMSKTFLALVCLLGTNSLISYEYPKKITHIMLDNADTAVYFNDGDTFKIVDTDLAGERVRIEGFNALESYGPVHEWLDNSTEYLYDISQEATHIAQNGRWHCVLLDDKDTYGRLLARCDDLAKALIEKGLAHAYSIDSRPANRSYLMHQKKAQKYGMGMWQNGIPEYMITSLHALSEGTGQPYNRLISADDGHTKKMHHQDDYTTCQKVCLEQDHSCMVYVPFMVRYEKNRPDCLMANVN